MTYEPWHDQSSIETKHKRANIIARAIQTGRRAQVRVLIYTVLTTVADQYVRSLKKVFRASDFRVSFVDLPGPGPLGHPCDPCREGNVPQRPGPLLQRKRGGPRGIRFPARSRGKRAGLSETGGERTKRVGPHEVFGFGYGAEPSDMSTHHGRIL